MTESAPSVSEALAQGIAAAQAGQRQQARRLFTGATQRDPQNDLAWLWLATVVDEPQQRADCIARALAANPDREPGRLPLKRLSPAPSRPDGRRFSRAQLGWLSLSLVGLLLLLGSVAGLVWLGSSSSERAASPADTATARPSPTGTSIAPATPPSGKALDEPFPAPVPQMAGMGNQEVAYAIPQAGLVNILESPGQVQALLSTGALKWISTQNGLIRWNQEDGTLALFTPADGLPEADVRALAWDGGLWVGTGNGGLAYFDGRTWSVWRSTDGLADERVTALCFQSHHQGLWVGTRAGLSRRTSEDQWQTFGSAAGLPGEHVTALALGADDSVWAGLQGDVPGLARYDQRRETWTALEVGSLGAVPISALAPSETGGMWAGTQGGQLAHFDGQTWDALALPEALAGRAIRSISGDASRKLWIAVEGGGLGCYDGQTWQVYAQAADSTPLQSPMVALDDKGQPWAATAQGVYQFSEAEFVPVDLDELTRGGNIPALVVDGNGEVWLSVLGEGLLRYDGQAWQRLDESSGLPGDWSTILAADEAGGLWAGSNSSPALAHFDGQTWEVIKAIGNLRGRSPAALAPAGAGGLWVIWDQSALMSHYQDGAWQSFDLPDKITGQSNRLVRTSSGDLWLKTDDYVARWSGGAWQTFSRRSLGYSDYQVKFSALAEDEAGYIWISTDGFQIAPQDRELRRYDGSEWAEVPMPRTLVGVDSLAPDAQGGFWLDGEQSVAHYDGARWQVYAVPPEIAGWNVRLVVLDPSGRVWALGQEGVAWLSPYEGRWESRLNFQD